MHRAVTERYVESEYTGSPRRSKESDEAKPEKPQRAGRRPARRRPGPRWRGEAAAPEPRLAEPQRQPHGSMRRLNPKGVGGDGNPPGGHPFRQKEEEASAPRVILFHDGDGRCIDTRCRASSVAAGLRVTTEHQNQEVFPLLVHMKFLFSLSSRVPSAHTGVRGGRDRAAPRRAARGRGAVEGGQREAPRRGRDRVREARAASPMGVDRSRDPRGPISLGVKTLCCCLFPE